jgi:hypothetical protein
VVVVASLHRAPEAPKLERLPGPGRVVAGEAEVGSGREFGPGAGSE